MHGALVDLVVFVAVVLLLFCFVLLSFGLVYFPLFSSFLRVWLFFFDFGSLFLLCVCVCVCVFFNHHNVLLFFLFFFCFVLLCFSVSVKICSCFHLKSGLLETSR